VRAPVRVTGIRPGVVFVPFHYGYWDRNGDGNDRDRAANEMTITEWDPVSKQPIYKTAACRIEKVADGDGSPARAPTTTASQPLAEAPPTAGGRSAEIREELES
jgi:predicted molibdopterin-dependent oxidoreductase YjgC